MKNLRPYRRCSHRGPQHARFCFARDGVEDRLVREAPPDAATLGRLRRSTKYCHVGGGSDNARAASLNVMTNVIGDTGEGMNPEFI